MKASKKTLAIVVGSAFVASIAATPLYAAGNPFAIKSLSSGYMVAEADTAASADKPKDGKCGTGKCTASMKKAAAEKAKMEADAATPAASDKPKDGKCGTGKCTASKKKAMAEAAAAKASEGSCSADKAKEGSCHANK